MLRHVRVLFVSLLLVLSLVAMVPLSSSAENQLYTVDGDTTLDDDEQLQAYEVNGTAVGESERLDLTITVADDQRDAGLDAYTAGWGHTWVRIQYNESIERTVRFYLPAEYAEPRLNRGIDAENDEDVTVALEPVMGGDYTAVTVELEGETDATFGINDFFGMYVGARNDGAAWVENTTGISVPSPGASSVDQWQYVPEYALDGNETTYEIPTPPDPTDDETEENETSRLTASDMTIQYDISEEAEPADWRTVYSCDEQLEPVCTVESPENETPVLLSTDGEAPTVRYKYDRDRLTETRGAASELLDGLGEFWEDVTGIFGMVVAP